MKGHNGFTKKIKKNGVKIIVFGGDFNHMLPVILKGTKDDIIDVSIVMSPL